RIRNAREAAAVGAGRAGLSRSRASIGAALALHRASRDAEDVLLAHVRVCIDIARAAIVLGIARHGRELADGAGGTARVAVVAAADGVGWTCLAAIADARLTLNASEAAAVGVG